MQQANSTLLRCAISVSVLRAGAVRLMQGSGRTVDLRRDARGHGLITVARVLHEVSQEFRMLVDSDHEVEQLARHGIGADTAGVIDTDVGVLLGLPHSTGTAGQRPAMRVFGTVLSVKPIEQGAGVSYGYTYRAPRDSQVALVTGGYAQGLVRSLGNNITVDIAGTLHPVVGRVAMDVCVVDVGDAPVSAGDTVTFFGGTGPTAPHLQQWADVSGLWPEELATTIGLAAAREVEE
ncbi:alanine racemase [Microbacterium sp. YY-01]|uniref:alanine racemase n=1 Tax=Microbacterium sp. YY-01 TaxID=3421634 RepID=UPI003D178BE6